MAIVPNWAEPLRDSIRKQLSKSDLSFREFEKIRETAELLDGSAVYAELSRRLAQQAEVFEQLYQSALKQIGDGSISTVENGIRALERLEGYRDSAQKITEAHANVERLKQAAAERERRKRKRNIVIGIAAALAVVLAIVGVKLNAVAKKQATVKAIAGAQALADAGQCDEAIAAITDLYEDGKTGEEYPEIYAITETVLEKIATEEGVSVALKLCDKLVSTMPNAIQAETFHAFGETQLAKEEIARAQALADAGKNDDAIAALRTLIEDGKTGKKYPEMKAVIGTVLENTASEEGYSAAWELAQRVQAEGILDKQDLAYVYALMNYANSLDGATAWELIQEEVTDKSINLLYRYIINEAFERYICTLDSTTAWQLVQQESAGNFVTVSSDLKAGVFKAYISSLDSDTAWSVTFNERKNGGYFIDDELLNAVYAAHVQNLSTDEAIQELLKYYDENFLFLLPEDTILQVVDTHMRLGTEKIASGAPGMDVEAWVTAQNAWLKLDQFPLDPDLALQLVYALDDAGYDAAALLPNGIPVRIPLASRICDLRDALGNGNEPEGFLDLSAVLPVSVREKWDYFLDKDDPDTLDAFVTDLQRDDDNYSVRLLPEYLLRLPEEARPATYAQCASLLCMQNVYHYVGQAERTFMYYSREIIYYYPIYSALNMVAIYDLADPGLAVCRWIQRRPAQAEAEDWLNKYNRTLHVLDAKNRFGSFNLKGTEEAFEDAIAGFDTLRTMFGTKEMTDDAD